MPCPHRSLQAERRIAFYTRHEDGLPARVLPTPRAIYGSIALYGHCAARRRICVHARRVAVYAYMRGASPYMRTCAARRRTPSTGTAHRLRLVQRPTSGVLMSSDKDGGFSDEAVLVLLKLYSTYGRELQMQRQECSRCLFLCWTQCYHGT